MRKLLSKPTTSPPEATGLHATNAPPVTLAYRPSTQQDAVYQAGVPIAALDRSPDGRSAVLGGRHILKTLRVEGTTVQEGVDLRALITGQAGASQSEQLSIRDVKWARGGSDTCIFTACLAGKIFRYDLASLGSFGGGGSSGSVVCTQAQEDGRQINTLDINPHRGTYLLSGGQDGAVRCLDIRAAVPSRTGPTFRALLTFRGHADSVRHVQWSPRDAFYFACGTEQGVVLKWDIRKASAPILRIGGAHEKACTSVSWHPDGAHLLSTGSDHACHVWDMSPAADRQRRPRPILSLVAPAPVSAAAWRPGQWSATGQGLRAAQVAVAYGEVGSAPKQRSGLHVVHVWDFARPSLPYRAVERFFSASPAALLWTSSRLLWTAGPDGIFAQSDVAHAPSLVDRTAVSTLAFSPRGDVLTLLDERPRPVQNASVSPPPPPPTPSSTNETAALTIRSDSEDEGLRRFLTPRRRCKRRGSSAQPQNQPQSSNQQHTQPQQQQADTPLLTLEQSLHVTGTYRPQQIMAIGHVPSAARPDVYGYLASHYLESLEQSLMSGSEDPLTERLVAVLDTYAHAAENVCQFRLAQVWRILAFAMDLLLQRRFQYHQELREQQKQLKQSPHSSQNGGLNRPHGENHHRPLRSLLTEEMESTSNVPTPLVRAQPDRRGVSPLEFDDDDSFPGGSHGSFALPAAAHLLDSDRDRRDTHLSSTEGYDFYDTEAMARAIDVPGGGALRRALRDTGHARKSSLDLTEPSTPEQRQPLVRQESEQIFTISQNSPADGHADPPDLENGTANKQPSQKPTSPRSLRSARLAYLNKTIMAGVEDSFCSLTQDTPSTTASQSATADTERGVFHSPSNQSEPAMPSRGPSPSFSSADADYLPWPNDPPYPFPLRNPPPGDGLDGSPALHPYVIVQRALAFETRTSPLNAAAMILLLQPFVPEAVIDPLQAAAILRQHHARLMGMRLFLEAALLRKLMAAHASKCKVPGPSLSRDGTVAYFCPQCRKPRDLAAAASVWCCERCSAVMGGCAVCGLRGEAGIEDLSVGPATWWYCPSCGHGGHSSCLTGWHADNCRLSDGCCPLDGCGHACLPGRWRTESALNRSEELTAAVRGATTPGTATPVTAGSVVGGETIDADVRPDGHEVTQSRAVDMVRDSLAGRDVGRLLGTSPGRGETRERRKSVKFVAGGEGGRR